MKNYTIITVAALLAAGTALANAGIVTATTAEKDNQGNYYGFTLALGTNSSALSYSDDIIKTATGEVNLDSLGLLTRSNTGGPSSTKIAIYEYTADATVGSFVGISDALTTSPGAELSFSFDGVKLELDKRYQFLFVSTEATAENLTDLSDAESTLLSVYREYSQSFGIAVTADKYAGTLPSGWGTYKNNTINQWEGHRMPVLSITVSADSIPEPSAFGLLAGLGALALAGTRRRRRK